MKEKKEEAQIGKEILQTWWKERKKEAWVGRSLRPQSRSEKVSARPVGSPELRFLLRGGLHQAEVAWAYCHHCARSLSGSSRGKRDWTWMLQWIQRCGGLRPSVSYVPCSSSSGRDLKGVPPWPPKYPKVWSSAELSKGYWPYSLCSPWPSPAWTQSASFYS